MRARDPRLFDLFEEAALNVERTAELLEELLRDYPENGQLAREILKCEQEGDRITQEVIRRLNVRRAGPIDRDDAHALAVALDDVVDYVEEVADLLGLYRIEAPMEQSQQLAGILLDACRQIARAMPLLRRFEDVSSHRVEVNRLENDGDRATRDAVAALFDGGIDPMVVIRWKDIFERLEEAIDSTERVVNVLDGIVVRHS